MSRTPFYIELTDAAGKKATGYIGAVGAGEALGSELITVWINNDYNTFVSSEKDISSAIASAPLNYGAYTIQILPTQDGLYLLSLILTLNSGTTPKVYEGHTWNVYDGGLGLTILVAGSNNLYFTSTDLAIYTIIINSAAGDWSSINTLKRVTDPPSTAVHIVSSLNGTIRDWASIESGFDPNNIASWKIYDLSHPGFYLPNNGSTFNRGDFTNGNAFFWSSLDLSTYAGSEADSIRQCIISAVDTRLKAILLTGGYKTNLGQHIFAWKATPLGISDLDGLNYRDPTEPNVLGCGIYDHILRIEVDLYSSSPENIRKCLADVEKAVFVDDTWGSLADASDIDTSEMAIEQKENKFCASKIILTINYRTIRGDPDSQP